MATLAETLLQNASESIEKNAPNLVRAAEIGRQRAELQQKQAILAQQQKDLADAKITKFSDALSKAQKLDPATRKNYMKNFIPRMRDALGLTEMFPDESLQFATATDQNLARVATLASRVRQGLMTQEEAISILNTPDSLADVPPEITTEVVQQLGKAETTAVMAKAQENRQKSQQEFTAEEKVKEANRTGQVALAAKVAADYAKFNKEGQAAAENKIVKLERVLKGLQDGTIQTGTVKEKIPYGANPAVLSRLNPKLKAAIDDVQSAISLKGQLDSQFSEKEAEKAFGRSFDATLPNSENIRKVSDMLRELKGNYRNSINQFKQQGFIPVNQEFSKPVLQAYPGLTLDSYNNLSEAAKKRVQEKEGKSDAQIRKALGGQ